LASAITQQNAAIRYFASSFDDPARRRQGRLFMIRCLRRRNRLIATKDRNLPVGNKLWKMLMDNERVILAIGRLERALSRIESANSSMKASFDPALEARHEALKAEMKQAIRTIDGLIERQEH
jgi:hypothetical protein